MRRDEVESGLKRCSKRRQMLRSEGEAYRCMVERTETTVFEERQMSSNETV